MPAAFSRQPHDASAVGASAVPASTAPRRCQPWQTPTPARFQVLFFFVLLLTPSPALQAADPTHGGADDPAIPKPDSIPAQAEVRITWGARVPMRDGVTLHANVYRPADQEDPLPAIFVMSPYTVDTYHGFGTWFAARGYTFVAADVRGRGNSEGTFHAFFNDPEDGADAVTWIAEQPWCDGQVAMWGSSYRGMNQWQTLMEQPPALKTICPVASCHPGIDFPMFNNIQYPYNMMWLSGTSGNVQNRNLSGDEKVIWKPCFGELYDEHLPFKQLDAVCGNPSAGFQRWVAHPTIDDYWRSMAPTAADYAQMDVPIMTVTGHYDADQHGALTFYRRHMQHGSPAAKEQHHLVIGPWTHAGTVHPQAEFRGLKFAPHSVIGTNELHLAWYDWVLKDGEKPAFLKDRVTYYLAGPGAERWAWAPTLAAVADETLTLHLHDRDGGGATVFDSGMLQPAVSADAAAYSNYTYDPLDTAPGKREREPSDTPDYIDQTHVLTLGERGLVFHTAPFDEPITIAGFPSLTLWIELDVPDTDFQIALHEIRPDGKSIRLATDSLRARYRDSLSDQTLVPPGEVIAYTFDTFNFFARRLAEGSFLRLVVTCPNTIFQQKNYNSGGVVAEETATEARVAHVKVYHSAEYPSRLTLPIQIAADNEEASKTNQSGVGAGIVGCSASSRADPALEGSAGP